MPDNFYVVLHSNYLSLLYFQTGTMHVLSGNFSVRVLIVIRATHSFCCLLE